MHILRISIPFIIFFREAAPWRKRAREARIDRDRGNRDAVAPAREPNAHHQEMIAVSTQSMHLANVKVLTTRRSRQSTYLSGPR